MKHCSQQLRGVNNSPICMQDIINIVSGKVTWLVAVNVSDEVGLQLGQLGQLWDPQVLRESNQLLVIQLGTTGGTSQELAGADFEGLAKLLVLLDNSVQP